MDKLKSSNKTQISGKIKYINNYNLEMARTQLQDAVPITLGQEFQAFAVSTNNDILRLNELLPLLSEEIGRAHV